MMDSEFPAYKLNYELYGLEAPLAEENETDLAEEEDLGAYLNSNSVPRDIDPND